MSGNDFNQYRTDEDKYIIEVNEDKYIIEVNEEKELSTKGDTWAIMAFVFGIVGIVLSCTGMGFALSIYALAVGLKAMRYMSKKKIFAGWGIGLGVVGLILQTICTIVFVVVMRLLGI